MPWQAARAEQPTVSGAAGQLAQVFGTHGSSRAGRRAVKLVTSTEWPACIFVLGKGV
jgi:hypothetical protein